MNNKEYRKRYLELRDKLFDYQGVLGVGMGQAEKDGKPTGEQAIVILVEKKLPADKVKKGEFINLSYKGVRVDVREPRINREQYLAYLKRNNIQASGIEENPDETWLDDGKLHEMFQRRRKLKQRKTKGKNKNLEPSDTTTPSPTITNVIGDIFVIEDKDCQSIINEDDTIDHVAAWELFRTQFGDHYDFVLFTYHRQSGTPLYGWDSQTYYNQISGINHNAGDSYDHRYVWGSSKLQCVLKFPWMVDIMHNLHEFAHRWCAYVYHQENGVHNGNLHEAWSDAPNQKPYHWGTWFDNGISCMGYDCYYWVNSEIPGEFRREFFTVHGPTYDKSGYHPLDLYLMGLIDPSEVGDFRYILNPTDPDSDYSYAGTEVKLTIKNVTDEEGYRNPAYPNTQRIFHQAYIFITKDMSTIGPVDNIHTPLHQIETYRAGMDNIFRRRTWGRAMVDSSLLRDNYQDIHFLHHPSRAVDSSLSGIFWNSIDIWVRNLKDGQTTHQNVIIGQHNYIYIKARNSGPNEYQNVIIRVYLAKYFGTEYYYPEDWHPDNLIGQKTITIPANASATAVITWDLASAPNGMRHANLLAEIIPMEVTPEGRHHVFDNRKITQKAVDIVDAIHEEEPRKLEFHFGHATRKSKKIGILTISRIKDLPNMELYLDSGGAEVNIQFPRRKIPGNTESAQNSPLSPSRKQVLHLELIHALKGTMSVYHLPAQTTLCLNVTNPGAGIIPMALYVTSSHTAHDISGIIRITQSELDWTVMGGIDWEVHS